MIRLASVRPSPATRQEALDPAHEGPGEARTCRLPIKGPAMLTLTTALLFTGLIVAALYTFGIFNTPYTGAFRFAFYLLLVLLLLSVGISLIDHPDKGYDPTVQTK